MNLSNRGSLTSGTKQSFANKETTLNPNAAEFVPFSLRSSVSQLGSSSNDLDSSSKFHAGSIRKAAFDRSGLSVSNFCNNEALHILCHQLPDDITTDFRIMSENESQDLEGLSLANLVLHDCSEASRLCVSSGGEYEFIKHQEPSGQHFNGASLSEKMRYVSDFPGKDLNSASYLHSPVKPLDKQIFNSDRLLGKGKDIHSYHQKLRHMIREPAMVENIDINPLEFLASHFPGFADVYYANGCDLDLTVEMLAQLEVPSKIGTDFASAVRKLASQDSGTWKYDRNGSASSVVGSSRSSHVSANSYSSITGKGLTLIRCKIVIQPEHFLFGLKLEKQWVMFLHWPSYNELV